MRNPNKIKSKRIHSQTQLNSTQSDNDNALKV